MSFSGRRNSSAGAFIPGFPGGQACGNFCVPGVDFCVSDLFHCRTIKVLMFALDEFGWRLFCDDKLVPMLCGIDAVGPAVRGM